MQTEEKTELKKVMTFRVTRKERAQIERKARDEQTTVTNFILDSIKARLDED